MEQADHWKEFLEPELEAAGYQGVYKQKTRESMGQVCVCLCLCLCVVCVCCGREDGRLCNSVQHVDMHAYIHRTGR